jgi:cystathionine beta-lyase
VPINVASRDFADFSVILSSATKSFNIAGTKNSFAIIENADMREAFKKRQLANNQHEVSTLGCVATEAAYRQGEAWLAELIPVLEHNVDYVMEYFAFNAPKVAVMQPEGTYLMWLDFSAYAMDDTLLGRIFHDEAKILLNAGRSFGEEGQGHARLNIAAPRANVAEACRRIVEALPKD